MCSLIVGLGNPGERYAHNRHNVGFMAIDRLIGSLPTIDSSKSAFKGELLKTSFTYLLKPKTFMNLSGESVQAVVSYFKCETVIAIHDDINLPLGSLRIKTGGGHGGHNGLRSMDEHIGVDYFRIRIGIGRPTHKDDVADYCLSDFSKHQKEQLADILQTACDAACALAQGEPLSLVCSKFTLSVKE